jgi:predicted O-methyltransferase YrrM
VYSSFQLAYKYIYYWFNAANSKGHGIHSPFVFEFITKLLNDKSNCTAYYLVEGLRKNLLNERRILSVEDFGAGSSVSKTNQRSVSSIAKNAARPKKYGQLLHRMVRYFKPATIIELGASLGITSSYLALGNQKARMISIEGSPEIAEQAKQIFESLELRNIDLHTGNFDEILPSVLRQLSSVGFAFIDGNHRYEPTIRYFNQLLEKSSNSTILVFDDIHWSGEMEKAWKEIKNHSSVTCSIDLFFIGIVFFRNEIKEKQHFKIRF